MNFPISSEEIFLFCETQREALVVVMWGAEFPDCHERSRIPKRKREEDELQLCKTHCPWEDNRLDVAACRLLGGAYSHRASSEPQVLQHIFDHPYMLVLFIFELFEQSPYRIDSTLLCESGVELTGPALLC